MEDLKQIQEFFSGSLEEKTWPEELTSRYSDEYRFELEKVTPTYQDKPGRAKYRVIDIESGELKGTPVFGSISSLQAFADDLIKPQGGTQSTNLGEMDINDPVLMKMRAAKMKANQPKKSINPNYKAVKNASKIAFLKKERAQLMRDMEQEAEPEGGPIADEYGRKLNRIDAAIVKLSGRKEMTYDQAINEYDVYMPSQDQVDRFFALTNNETHYLNSKPVMGQEGTFNLMPIEPWDEYDYSNWKALVRKAKAKGKSINEGTLTQDELASYRDNAMEKLANADIVDKKLGKTRQGDKYIMVMYKEKWDFANPPKTGMYNPETQWVKVFYNDESEIQDLMTLKETKSINEELNLSNYGKVTPPKGGASLVGKYNSIQGKSKYDTVIFDYQEGSDKPYGIVQVEGHGIYGSDLLKRLGLRQTRSWTAGVDVYIHDGNNNPVYVSEGDFKALLDFWSGGLDREAKAQSDFYRGRGNTSGTIDEVKEEDKIDIVTMDVPLFIRILEYAREDAQEDMDLHDLAEKAISSTKQQGILQMDDYDMLVGEMESIDENEDPKKVLDDTPDNLEKLLAKHMKVSPEELEKQATSEKEKIDEGLALTITLLLPAILELVGNISNKYKTTFSLKDDEKKFYEDWKVKMKEAKKSKDKAKIEALKKEYKEKFASKFGKNVIGLGHKIHKFYTIPITQLLRLASILPGKGGAWAKDPKKRQKVADLIYAAGMLFLGGIHVKHGVKHILAHHGVEVASFTDTILNGVKSGLSLSEIASEAMVLADVGMEVASAAA